MPFYKKPHRDTIIANSAATLSDIDVSSGTLTVDEVNSRVGIGTNTPSATLGVDGNVVVEPGGKLGIGLTAPDCPLDVNAANDLPQAIIRYGTSYKTDLLTTSNGMFRITPTARTLQVDTGDTNGGNIQFTKAGGTVSGAISWDTGDKDVTLYSDANLYLGAGGSAADLTLNADGTAQFGGAVTATGITIGNTAITASGAELNYSDGVTSNIQTQIDSKGATAGSNSLVTVGTITNGTWNGGAIASAYLDAQTAHLDTVQTFTGAKSFTGGVTIEEGELTLGSTAITSTAAEINKLDGYTGSVTELNYLDTLHATGVTDTEFDYLDGVTSNIQTQIDSKGATAGSGSITTVGTIGNGTWQGTAIASAYLDADTAHLSGTQTVTGDKTFTGITTLADTALAEGKGLTMLVPTLPSTDHTSTGLSAQMLAGGAIGAFQTVCIHTTANEVVVTDANAAGTMPVIGIATAAISDTATGTILLQGFIRHDTWNWTPGGILYASETAGEMTHTAPTTSGARVQALGVSLSADVVYWNPSLVIVEVD